MAGPIALERFGSPRPENPGAAEAGTEVVAVRPDEDDAAGRPGGNLEAGRLACLERIAGALEIVAAEQAALRARCIGDTVTALGAAAETLLPRLAREGFAALVAETAQAISRRGQWPELLLSVTPDSAAAVSAALDAAGTGAVTEIKVSADPALGPGEAQVAWSEGGAEIDADAIAEAALEHFRRHLDRCLQPGA